MSDDGLEERYEVRRRHDPDGKHAKCGYFVLDPQHDPIARSAMRCYAEEVAVVNAVLAVHLLAWVDGLERPVSDE